MRFVRRRAFHVQSKDGILKIRVLKILAKQYAVLGIMDMSYCGHHSASAKLTEFHDFSLSNLADDRIFFSSCFVLFCSSSNVWGQKFSLDSAGTEVSMFRNCSRTDSWLLRLFVFFFLVIFPIFTASAATFRVTGNGDATGAVTPTGNPNEYSAPSLRAAIDAANDETNHAGADTIVFDLPAGQETISVSANDTNKPFAFGPTAFVINSNIKIQGAANEPAVTIDGQNQRRLFGVMSTASLSLELVTLTGGKVQGGKGGSVINDEAGGGAVELPVWVALFLMPARSISPSAR